VPRRTALACAVVFVAIVAASLVQPTRALGTDIRFRAIASLADVTRTFMGDPGPSVVAAARLRADPRAPLYDGDPTVGSSFIYPPIAAILYAPLVSMQRAEARDALAMANHLLFFAIALALALFVDRQRRPLPMLIAGAACVAFYPLVHAVELNQATVLVTALVAGAFLALDAKCTALAGVLFALTFGIKPHLALVLPLLAWHLRRMVVAALVTSIALAAGSLAYAGVANHVDYVTKMLPALAGGYSYYANQSYNGLLNRLFVGGDLGVFVMPPTSPAVRVLTLVFGAATYAGALWLVWRWRALRGVELYVFGFAWLATTIVSPIAWQHHYAPALFLFALVWRALRDEPELRARGALPALVAFGLMGSYFEVRAAEGPLASLAVSYVLAGALVLLGTVAWLTPRVAAPESRPGFSS
jgi:hypothetical protein